MRNVKVLVVCAVMLMVFGAGVAVAGPTEEQVLVDKAQLTFRDFTKAPEMEMFRDALKDARGVMIIPDLFKAGLVFGGSGGEGVYLAKNKETGEWSGPAFYNLGSFTFGLQIGGEKAEVVVLAMTDDAVKAMISPQFKLGGDFSVAAGPVGMGAAGGASLPTAAFISFARAQGAYAGLTLEGAVITVDGKENGVYYGKDVTPEAILMTGEAVSADAAGLREEVRKAAK